MKRTYSIFLVFILFLYAGCTLETFKDFSVTSVSIKENGVIGTGRGEIEILFSKEVNEQSAQDFIKIETDSSVEISCTMHCSGKMVLLIPDEDWIPHERYWLYISKEMKDIYGKKMGNDFCLPFQSTDELLPVSAVLLSPKVVNGQVYHDTGFIELMFNKEVDKNSVEREFSVSPFVEGNFEWTLGRAFMFSFTDRLEKNRFYTVKISQNARDFQGYEIRPFECGFEYFPNQLSPGLQEIWAEGHLLFDRADPLTYEIERGSYIIDYTEAEKELSLTFKFMNTESKIDRSSLRNNFHISPSAEWHETWLDDYTVNISFDEPLVIQEYYEISIDRGIENIDGLNMLYDFLMHLFVNGEYSRYLEFYADEISDLKVDAVLTQASGQTMDGVRDVFCSIEDEGPLIEIVHAHTIDREKIEGIELKISLLFNASGYTPSLDRSSVQDALSFRQVFGEKKHAAALEYFDWDFGEVNECQLHITGVWYDTIYCLTIVGDSGGVIDSHGNYMKEDIDFYFKVGLSKEGG
jgi:hypothetical protein